MGGFRSLSFLAFLFCCCFGALFSCVPCHAFTIPGLHLLLCPIRTDSFLFLGPNSFAGYTPLAVSTIGQMARGRTFASLSLSRSFHILIGTLSLSFLQTRQKTKTLLLAPTQKEIRVHIQPHVRRRLASFSAGRVSNVSSRRPCCLSASLPFLLCCSFAYTHYHATFYPPSFFRLALIKIVRVKIRG